MVYTQKPDYSWRNGTKSPYNRINIHDSILDTTKKPSVVKSVFRAANILTCLSHGIYTITDIAAVCQLNKATVHRLLKALVESRLAIQDPINHRYYLGQSIAQIVASPYTTHEYLVTSAVQPMLRLSKITEETIFISILLGIKEIVLFEIPSKHDLRVVETSQKGGYAPVGAASKVLLSMLGNRELNIAIQNIDFKSLAEIPDLNKEGLISQLKEIHRKGYCVTSGERIKGATCIAAPIKNYVLPVAMGIIGPESRIKRRIPEFAKALKATATQFSDTIEKLYQIK